GRHAGAALAAAMLRPIDRERNALDVAVMCDGDDHVLALDEVLIVHIGAAVDDLAAARRAKLVAYRRQFVLDDLLDARARRQDVEIIRYLGADLVQFVGNLIPAERSKARQTQFEDRAGLLF